MLFKHCSGIRNRAGAINSTISNAAGVHAYKSMCVCAYEQHQIQLFGNGCVEPNHEESLTTKMALTIDPDRTRCDAKPRPGPGPELVEKSQRQRGGVIRTIASTRGRSIR